MLNIISNKMIGKPQIRIMWNVIYLVHEPKILYAQRSIAALQVFSFYCCYYCDLCICHNIDKTNCLGRLYLYCQLFKLWFIQSEVHVLVASIVDRPAAFFSIFYVLLHSCSLRIYLMFKKFSRSRYSSSRFLCKNTFCWLWLVATNKLTSSIDHFFRSPIPLL